MRMAGERAEAPFLLFEDQRWSFGATADIALRGATWLDKLGVEAGDRVVLAIGNRPMFVFAWFALLARGAVAVPVSPEMFGDPLRYIVSQSESRFLLCEAADHARFAAETAPCGVTVRSFADEAAFVADIVRHPLATPAPARDHTPAAILYTSGTTGQPKGVVIPNRSYLAAGEKVTEAIGITAEDRIMTFLPLHHANPQMYSIMSALTAGCSVAIVPRFSASRFLEQAAHYRATGFTYVGTVLSILAKEWSAPVQSSLRWCVGGGAPRAVWERLNSLLPVQVHELYGMTETGGLVTINARSRYRFGSVGAARDDFDVVALDEDGRVLPPGRTGEIAVRPRQPWVMMSGYFRKPEETLAAMDNLWFHTGDLGRFDDEGFLYFEGRKKELIRRGGEMISPVEIELAALKFPQVADCAAVGVADEILEEDIKLVVVRRDGFDADALLAHLRGALPRHMLPRYLEFVSEIPKTPTQKVQRFRLVRNSEATVDLRGPRVSG
ncbi:crotonobetaine/carnitine-CoA ligase [Cupriavidus gilardii J11]|uniref:Crotonobetaine/carnitine-CoA ligase n=1 Tax=Cupriavidus gilardii J11 TaxID=936133 RepID=A0A562BK01_9BURK|nr:crotonobetaine/carnitine-CoA ligase [Cupriavidus gilardii J11]